MDMKRLQYNELLDNELAHSKHDLSDRDITFIDQKKVRSIQGLFEKILGRQHQEIQMKFRDPELKCNFTCSNGILRIFRGHDDELNFDKFGDG